MGARLRRATAADATQLGVDPALWVRITCYWAETTEGNRAHLPEGYAPGALTRRDFATLNEVGAALQTAPLTLLSLTRPSYTK